MEQLCANEISALQCRAPAHLVVHVRDGNQGVQFAAPRKLALLILTKLTSSSSTYEMATSVSSLLPHAS